jgi:hypothetical protein
MLKNSLVQAGLGIACLFSITACKTSKHSAHRLPGVWQGTPITIDGSNKDWPSPYPEYDEKASLGYAVSNDKDYLFITVETGDPATQLKILREGLTVWIDRTGEKSEETAINFPIPMSHSGKSTSDAQPRRAKMQEGDGKGGSREQQQRLDLEDKVRVAMKSATEFSLQGFKSCNLQYGIMETDSCGVVVRMALDENNELVWEAAVPFKSFYFKPQLTRADKGKVMTVCFETVGVERPAGGYNNGNHGGGGMRPSMGMGGMGMRMGGGGGGYRGRSQPQQQNNIMEPLYKSTKTYKKFGLAFE